MALRRLDDYAMPDGSGAYQDDYGVPYVLRPEDAAPPAPPPEQIDPSIAAAVAPGPDMRTAEWTGGGSGQGSYNPGGADQYASAPDYAPAGPPPTGPQPDPHPTIVTPPAAPPPTEPHEGPPPMQAPEQAQPTAADYVRARLAQPGGGATPAHWSPGTRSETTTDAGLPYDPALVKQRQDAFQNEWNVKQSVAEAKIADNVALSRKEAGRIVLRRDEVDDRQIRLNKIKADYTQKRQAVQADLDKALSGQVDPTHWFSEKNAFSKGIVVLAQMFGALGQAYSHTPNVAFEMMNKEIDADIAAQRDNLARNGTRANNKLSQIMNDQGVDIDDASNMLRASQQQLMTAQAQQFAAATQSKDVMDAFNVAKAQAYTQYVKDDQAARREALGKMTQSGTEHYVAATSAAGNQHSRVMSAASEAAALQSVGALSGATKDVRAETAELAKNDKELVKQQTATEPVRTILQKYQGAKDIPGTGVGEVIKDTIPGGKLFGAVFDDKEEKKNESTIDRFLDSFIVAKYGERAAADPHRAEALKSSLWGMTRSPDRLRDLVNEYDTMIGQQRASLHAGASPQAKELYYKQGGYAPKRIPSSARRIGE